MLLFFLELLHHVSKRNEGSLDEDDPEKANVMCLRVGTVDNFLCDIFLFRPIPEQLVQ